MAKLHYGLCMLFILNLSCTKLQSDYTNQQNYDFNHNCTTKATQSAWHWKCKKCGMLNGGWRNNCVNCKEEFNKQHGAVIVTFLDLIQNKIQISLPETGGGNSNTNPLGEGSIQLPDGTFTITKPGTWYEGTVAMQMYNELIGQYSLKPAEYIEAADVAWYRTVRALYPKYHKKTVVEQQYTKWKLNASKELKNLGWTGPGILDGTDAAVKAFLKYSSN